MEAYLIWIFLLLVAYLVACGFLASKASDIAKDKGYNKRTWFHMCFWLGLIAYLLVLGMPDLVQREQQRAFGERLLETMQLSDQAAQARQQANVSSYLPEL